MSYTQNWIDNVFVSSNFQANFISLNIDLVPQQTSLMTENKANKTIRFVFPFIVPHI